MATYGKKHDPIRLLWQRLGIVALLVVLLIALSGVWDVYQKERESRLLREQSEREAADLSAQVSDLHENIAKLQTTRGKEEVLREQYNVGKAGEQLIIIVDPEETKPIEASSTIMRWVHKFLPFW